MASYPAPTQNIEFFNPAFFTVDETALTIGEANKIYFKKSGGIITGSVSMPSLTLNGVNVENKLLEIDTVNAKLTDISYNNNVTYILNDLSVNGILKLPNLTNAGSEILNNKQKTTKISYDAGTSITTIGDTLKVPSTLIVGSNNYNVNDQFYKLTGISRDTNTPSLTITDSVQINGVLNLPNNGNVDVVLSNFDTILVNMEYVQETDKLIIDSNVNVNQDMVIDGSLNVTGNFKLNSISDVEQKIIDVSNAVTPYISYDSVNDKLVVEKDMDLSIKELNCNFMRKVGTVYRLSQNFSTSYLEFRNGGHHIDSFHGNGSGGRVLYLNYYANSNVNIGGQYNLTTTNIFGNLTCNRNFELDGSFNLGTITDVEQKILDVSNTTTNLETNVTGISYNTIQDLTTIDNSLNVTGNLQLNTITDVEQKILDISSTATNLETILTDVSYVNSTTIVGGKLNIEEATGTAPTATGGSLTLEHNDNGGTSSIVFKSKIDNNSDYGYISYTDNIDNAGGQKSLLEIGVQNDSGSTPSILDNIALMPSGFLGINTRTPQTMLDVNGDIKCNGNFELGTITDVEQKIIDISNNAGGTPYISYDSVNDKLDVEKDMDLSLNDLTCNFMRPSGFFYRLSQNHTDSYLEFRNGGHHLDSFYSSNGLGRALYLGYYSLVPTILSSGFVTQKASSINEAVGTPPGSSGGSLTLIHNDNNGTSSIVFKSKNNGSDFGYISYKDDVDDAGGEKSLLEIGVKNDSSSTPSEIDNIALMPSGFLGINRRDPEYMLDLSGDMRTYDTIIGERPFLNTDGNGISIKPLTNPSLNGGSIFDVRTSLDSCRLFVGRGVTSCGFNNFCFGWDVTASNGTEGDPTNYSGILGTDGSVDCTEIKVNSIPINSFTNFGLAIFTSRIEWGQGRHLVISSTLTTPSYSHSQQFQANTSDSTYTCNSGYYGTYEITCNAIFRNNTNVRLDPCIGIAIDDDTDTTGSPPSPEWAFRPHYQTPFSAQYVRNSEGRVCNLSCKRIYNFIDSTKKVSINTYVQKTVGTTYTDFLTISEYELLDATIQFKYLGNFDNIQN